MYRPHFFSRPFCILRDVWIRTQKADVANGRATNLATHIHNLATHLPNLATHIPKLAPPPPHLPVSATHLPNLASSHPSP